MVGYQLPKNSCSSKSPKREVVDQLCGQLEEYLKGLLPTGPLDPCLPPQGRVPPAELLEFLEYGSYVIVSVVYAFTFRFQKYA